MNVSHQFVDELFANQHFNTLLAQFNSAKTPSTNNHPQLPVHTLEPISVDKVIEDINTSLYNLCKQAIATQCNHLYQSHSYLLAQIESLKLKISAFNPQHYHSASKSSPQQNPLSTSIFFDPDNDLKQMRQNINSLQSQLQLNHNSLIHSFQIYEHLNQTSKEHQQLQFDLEFKLNQKLTEQTSKISEEIKLKIEKFQTSVEQRLQQLKKTITKVVQAMNDPSFWANHNNPEALTSNNQKLDHKLLKTASDKENQRNSLKFSIKENYQEKYITESPKKLNSTLQSSPSDKKQDSGSGSNKTMESLNKSFNFGKTKIKSLFGFKANPKLPQSPLKTLN